MLNALLIGILVSILVAIIWLVASLFGGSKYYNGGHAAGRVHHRRSWEDYPESDREYRRWKMSNR